MKLKEQIDCELHAITPKEEILQDILASRQKRPLLPKSGLILCAALFGLLLVIPVSAKVYSTLGETTRITKENRELIDQAGITSSEARPVDETIITEPDYLMNDLEKVSEATNGIIQEIEDDAFLPNTVTVIALSPTSDENIWEIPELLTDNGFCTIFTQENGEGWELKAGESLRIQYSIGTTADTNPDNPQEHMQIGYIGNHVFYEGRLYYAQEFEYTLYAPEDGIYYLYNTNFSAGKILITEGDIR